MIWKSSHKNILYLRKRSCNHNDDYSPCSRCDLKTPIYNPLEDKKNNALENANPMTVNQPHSNSILSNQKKSKKQSVHTKKHIFAVGDWIAFKESSQFYLGKIKLIDAVGDSKKFRVENLLSRVNTFKHFECYTAPDEIKDVAESDVICHIKPPKELQRPKNVYSIKELKKIEEILNV